MIETSFQHYLKVKVKTTRQKSSKDLHWEKRERNSTTPNTTKSGICKTIETGNTLSNCKNSSTKKVVEPIEEKK